MLVMASVLRQVLIEATIVEVALNDSYQFGIDWKLVAGDFSFTQLLSGAPTRTNGQLDNNQFLVGYSSKNLTAALIVEAAELLEPFQWLTPEQSLDLPAPKKEAVRQEMADVLIYLVSLANCLEIDLLKAAEDKLAINAAKYPVEKAKGSCAKSQEL